jgi:hypothetical protein
MKRESFRATITRDGEVIGETVKYAFNSAIRASEALVRELARSEGRIYTGGVTQSEGERYARTRYTRAWSSGGAVVTATVEKMGA